MTPNEITTLFDQHAATYDKQWATMAPIRDCLQLILDTLLLDVPSDARILSVGTGTGVELAHLAQKNPGWRFAAVEPSGAMLEVCRERARAEGFFDRCVFHEGYLDTFSSAAEFDGATCFLVSQFILDKAQRVRFFSEIATRLKPGGWLANAELSADTRSPSYDVILPGWVAVMSGADAPRERIAQMREAFATSVGVLPSDEVAAIIMAGGFASPVPFFQAGLMRAWLSTRAAGSPLHSAT
jgi:tRNA (cmo5U34)-methyltransferase